MRTWSGHRPPVWLVLLVGTVYGGLFLCFLYNPANSIQSDSKGYIQLAENLRDHHAFSTAHSLPYLPDVYRLPGYPLFLAAAHLITLSFIPLAMALQCAMGIWLVFIMWPFLYRQGGPRGALLGTTFLCFDLIVVLHQDLIVSEALYTLISSIALSSAVLYSENQTTRRGAATGLLFGMSALIKPIAVLSSSLFVLCFFKNWKKTIWLTLFTFSLPACWVARNWVVTGHPVYTIQGSLTVLQYPAASVVALETGRSRHAVMDAWETKLRSELPEPLDPVALSFAYKQMAIQIIKQHPLATMKYVLVGVVRILSPVGLEMLVEQIQPPASQNIHYGSELHVSGSGTLALLRTYPVLIPIQLLYIVFVLSGYCMFSRGIRELLRRGDARLAAYLIFSIVAILLVSTVPGGYYRLRIPIVPFLALGIAASFPRPPEENDRIL